MVGRGRRRPGRGQVEGVPEADQVVPVESPEARQPVEAHELCVRDPCGREVGEDSMLRSSVSRRRPGKRRRAFLRELVREV